MISTRVAPFTVSLLLASLLTSLLGVDAGPYTCANEEYRATSTLACSTLEGSIPKAANYVLDGDICYLGKFSTCSEAGGIATAQAYCEAEGARLCTANEVLAGNFDGMSCGVEEMWTSSQCSDHDGGKFWVTAADGSGTLRCADGATESLETHCCGDTTAEVCEACPFYSSSGRNTREVDIPGVSECQCSYGYSPDYTDGSFSCTKDHKKGDGKCSKGEYSLNSPRSCDGKWKEGGGLANGKPDFKWGPVKDVCAKTHSITPGVACPSDENKDKDYQRAVNYCSQIGARLCTLNEIEEGAADDTGCGYDKERIWTGTPCGEDKYWTVGGSEKKAATFGGRATCTEQSVASYQVRCCADRVSHCETCPSGSSSSKGSVGVSSCDCDDDWNTDGGCITASPTQKPTKSPVPFPMCAENYYHGKSAKSCRTLGWGEGFGSKRVCASSVDINGDCPAGTDKKTFAEAEAYCETQGARLCNAQELKRGEAKNTGCDLDKKDVWSSTPCCDISSDASCDASSASRLVLKGYGLGKKVCTEETETKHARCCADKVLGNWCKRCPQYSKSSRGATDITDCACRNGYKGAPGGACRKITLQPTMQPTFVDISCGENEYAAGSTRSCAGLAWSYTGNPSKNGIGRKVCGKTQISDTCYTGEKLYSEAKAICDAVGARLCYTSREILKSVDDECSYEAGDVVWTNQPCGFDNGRWAHTLDGDDVCMEDLSSGTAKVACCADEGTRKGVATFCATCPIYSISTAGEAFELDDCVCESDVYTKGQSEDSRDWSGLCTVVTPDPTVSPTLAPTPYDCPSLGKGACRSASVCSWDGSACFRG